MTKLCKDCRHFEVSLVERLLGMSHLGLCNQFDRSTASESFLVTGWRRRDDNQFASIARRFSDYCGRDARFWEPK